MVRGSRKQARVTAGDRARGVVKRFSFDGPVERARPPRRLTQDAPWLRGPALTNHPRDCMAVQWTSRVGEPTT